MGTTNQEGEPTPMGMTEDVGDAQAEADRWNSKGNAYLAVRDYITAISCFDLALKTHPGSDQEDVFLSNRATAHFRTGRYEAAVEGFRNASRLRPDKHSHFTCLGKVYLRWGRHEAEALEALTESLRLEPTSVAANLAAKAQVALERAHQGAGGGGSFGSPAPSRISSSSPFQSPLSSSAGGSPSVPSDERNVRMLVRRDTNQRGELVAGSGAFVYGGGSNGGIVSGAKGERKGTPPAGNTRNNAHVHRGEGGDEREFQEEEAEAVVEPAVAAAASTRRQSRGSSTAPVDFETGGGGGIVGHRRASKSVEVNPSGGGGGGVFGRGRGRGAPRPAAEASAAAAAVTVAVKEEERAQAPPPPDGGREKPSSSSTLSSSSSLWAADSPKKEAVGDGGGGGNDSWGVDRFMSRLNIFSGRAEATAQARGAATRDRSSGGSSRSPQGGEGAGSGPAATTTSTTTPAESVSDSGPKSVSGSGSKSVSDSGLKSVSPSKAPTMLVATRARVAAKKVVPRGTRPMAQIAPLGRASPTTEAAAVLPPRITPPDATKKSRASRTGAGTASSRPPFRAAPTRTTSAAAAAATTVDPSRFLAGSRVREMEGGGTGGGENGSDNDDDDDDDDAFFSTALEAVAKAVHRLNPNDPAAPGSSAAEAAIEAAAAPVKWGKEAIAERENRRRGGPDGGRSATTAAAADREEEDPDDCLMPPSLGPLGSSDKFTRGPLAARGGGRGGGGAGGGGSDGSGGGGRGGGYRSANAREQQQQEQQHLFSGRLDTGADEENVSETKITAALVDGSRGSPARLAAQRAGLRRRMSSGSGGIGAGGDSGRGAGGGGEVRDGAGRGRVEEPASAPAAVAAAAALAGVEAAAAAAAAVAAAEAAAAAAAERRRMRAFAFRRSVSAVEASSSVFADEDPVSKDDGYYRRRGSWAHARMRSEDVVGNGVRRRSGGGSGFWYGTCGPCRPDRDEEDGWGSGWGGGGGGGSGRDGDRVSSQVVLSSTRHPDGEVFLDNDEEEWGQTAPTGRYWRLRWPGRHRYATVGACLESPAVMRVGSDYNFHSRASLLGSSDRESDARDGDGDGPSDNGSGSDHATGNASVNTNPKVFFSTSSTKSSPPAMMHVPGTERRQTHRRNVTLPAGGHQPTAIDRTATRIRPSSGGRRSSKDGASGGGGGKRLRRWVNERLSGGGGVPAEEAVRSWIIAVLGPRALSVVNGGEGGRVVSLAEGLKDGRVLVRLAHAVGGARTAGMGEELEATVPMLQLVNVHAFLAAARAIGVPEKNMFHPKDHVMTPTSGPCSPAVLKCLLALSDAVRRNACTDSPGDFYDGPLLGEGGRRAVRAESGGGGGGVSLVAGRGSKASRPEGRRGWGCRSSSGNVSSNDSGIGSGTSFDSGNSGGNGNGNPNSNSYGSGSGNGGSYGSGSGNGGGNGSGIGNTIGNGGVNLSPMATEKAEDVGEETPTSPDSTLSGVGSIGQGA